MLPKDVKLLEEIVNAANSDLGFKFVAPNASAQRLTADNLIEVNLEIVDGEGNFAARPTAEGLAMVGKTTEAEQEQVEQVETEVAPVGLTEVIEQNQKAAASAKMAFEVETGIPVPKVKRGRTGATMYPFDTMAVGDSFHVPPTEKKPNPAKSLASTVSSATRRYKDDEGNVTKRFVVRVAAADDPKGEGARVFRVS